MISMLISHDACTKLHVLKVSRNHSELHQQEDEERRQRAVLLPDDTLHNIHNSFLHQMHHTHLNDPSHISTTHLERTTSHNTDSGGKNLQRNPANCGESENPSQTEPPHNTLLQIGFQVAWVKESDSHEQPRTAEPQETTCKTKVAAHLFPGS
jgi:hypothetical protein